MPDMKSTNTEWLKDIPYHWGLSKINALYTLRNQKVSDRDYPPLSVTMKGILPQLDTAAKTNAHDDRKLVMKGDFAINSRSDRRGSCGISDYDGSVSLINTVMKPNGEMDPGYYNWLFHTTEFADEFYKWGHGIVDDLWTTNWQDMKHIDVPVPPLSEQHRIADFLDSKCSQIDEISKKIQEEIDTLEAYKKSVITEAVTKGLDPNAEMKDSGIEWIGETSKTHPLRRLKYIANVLDEFRKPIEASKRNQDAEVLFPYFGASGAIDMIDGYTIDDHVLLVGEDGANLRMRNLPLVYESAGKAWINNHAHIVKPKQFCDFYYLFYAIESMDINPYITGSAQPKFNQEKLLNMWIPFPTYEEQKQISEYLIGKCHQIDESIETKKQQLSTLEEYKKSLIYEYVTGKKKVA